MSNIWHDVEPSRMNPDDFIAVIEIEKGTRNKYELDKQTGHIILDRVLFTSTHYPANYGFLPRSYGNDGDPLDVLVLCSEAIYPLSMVRCFPIGMMRMIDSGRSDEKIIAVPFGDPNYNCYHDIGELPQHILSEMRHFFTVYKTLEGKHTEVDDFYDAAMARKVIGECLENYRKTFGDAARETHEQPQ